MALGVVRPAKTHYPAVQQDLAGVGRLGAGQNLHQRGFAGPVLSDQGMHVSSGAGQRHITQRLDAGKALADVAHLKQEGAVVHFFRKPSLASTASGRVLSIHRSSLKCGL